jgi:hypothetical protein
MDVIFGYITQEQRDEDIARVAAGHARRNKEETDSQVEKDEERHAERV